MITNIVSAEKPTIKEERKPWVIPVVVVASVVFLTLLIALLVWVSLLYSASLLFVALAFSVCF